MQFTLKHEEQLVVVIVLMPVVLALDDADAHNRVVDGAERLVEPRVGDGIAESLLIEFLQMAKFDVEF